MWRNGSNFARGVAWCIKYAGQISEQNQHFANIRYWQWQKSLSWYATTRLLTCRRSTTCRWKTRWRTTRQLVDVELNYATTRRCDNQTTRPLDDSITRQQTIFFITDVNINHCYTVGLYENIIENQLNLKIVNYASSWLVVGLASCSVLGLSVVGQDVVTGWFQSQERKFQNLLSGVTNSLICKAIMLKTSSLKLKFYNSTLFCLYYLLSD